MPGHEDDLLIAMNAGNEIRRRLVQEIGLDLDELGYESKELYDETFAQKSAECHQEIRRLEDMDALERARALLR